MNKEEAHDPINRKLSNDGGRKSVHSWVAQRIVLQDCARGRKDKLILKPRYYTTVAQDVSAALNLTMRRGVADGSITTLRQFIQEQERLRTELEKLVAPLDGGAGKE